MGGRAAREGASYIRRALATAVALRASGTVQTIAADFMI
jgi:hypothetical protein